MVAMKTQAAVNDGKVISPPLSPPPSPRRLSRAHSRRLYRTKSGGSYFSGSLIAFFLRRHISFFLLLPVLYVFGLLMLVGTVSVVRSRPLPGSLYRSGYVFRKLWPEMRSERSNSSVLKLTTVWRNSKRLETEKTCLNAAVKLLSEAPAPTIFLIVEANGGLNQQRSSICNAVAVAGLLNATLVIPQFQLNSVWKDPSKFGDIYNEDHFIRVLEGHVRIVRKLPEFLLEKFDHNVSNILNFRVKAWAPASYYMSSVYPVLKEQGVVRIAPFANRLALEVPPSIQYLRCLTNYEALKFSVPITVLAEQLVTRMVQNSSSTGGKYVSVHLRFEEDMVAFSCCEYDGGMEENKEMELARERGWRGKFKRKGRTIRPDLNRISGRCPLTPLEVGMMLRGMGFNNNTPIYLASGKIYREEKNLAPLRQMFPLLQTKESLATPEELASFTGYFSRLAALDYTVCLKSEVFVTTQGGNFPHFLMGHRRYLYDGHAKTIKPDKRKLVFLLQNTSISWTRFKDQMGKMLMESDLKGIAWRQRRQSIYEFPLPECSCVRGLGNSTLAQRHSGDAHSFGEVETAR
ncbi:O-fucosyltransferase 10-like [Aristolochia californica]|uniref:O-fucosyltransferase 10-like n=1 Tax=Aristolochia californica TaxID=171875 RepID=UPI0035D58A76